MQREKKESNHKATDIILQIYDGLHCEETTQVKTYFEEIMSNSKMMR